MNLRKTAVFLAISLPVGAALWWLWSTSRGATKSPRYTVVRADGPFELRDYPPLTVIDAPMTGAGANTSFRKLFRYITGDNDRREKIAMTTPVLFDAAGGEKTMGFILDEEVIAAHGAPKPLDDSLTVGSVGAARFAVLRFSGERSAANEANALAVLSRWVSAGQLTAKGGPIFAYYDPPWTPGFLRRNEVMVPVAR
jgi:hypothetical protein